MINPYSHPRLKRLKRRSKVRYAWACALKFPSYLVWKFSRIIPERTILRLRRRFAYWMTPVGKILAFFALWFKTRHWKLLLYSLPLIVSIVWIQSTIFLAKNQPEDELYQDYRNRLIGSVRTGEYEFAEFLSGKLLQKGSFRKDKRMLYAAMIAADKTNNTPRRDLILKRLTKELHYIPAYRWYAQKLIRAGGSANYQKAIEYINEARELDFENQERSINLAEMYFHSGRPEQAADILEGVKNPRIKTSITLAKVYTQIKRKQDADILIRKVLDDIRVLDPEKRKYIEERFIAYAILSDTEGDTEIVLNGFLDIINALEPKLKSSSGNERERVLLARSYMIVAINLIQANASENYLKVVEYCEKAVATGVDARFYIKLIAVVSNLSAGGGLTKDQMIDALVRGHGVPMAHFFLGLDFWKKGHIGEAKFHFKIAHKLDENTLRLVEKMATYLSEISNEGMLDPFKLSLKREPLWKRALVLLDMASAIDPDSQETNLLSRCRILSNRQQWGSLVKSLEPHVANVSDENKVLFYKFLALAYRQLRNLEKARSYQDLLTKMEEAKK